MGPKALLADLTRNWCSGSTESFDLSREGSSPFFLLGVGGALTPIVHSIKVVLRCRARLLMLKLWGEACYRCRQCEVPYNQGQCNREKVFSDEVYKLVIAEPGVRGPDSQEHDGEEGCFNHKVCSCK